MRPRSVGSRTLLLLCTALLAMGVGAVFMAADGLRDLELSSIDARFDLRGEQQPPTQVVVVGIDDETLDAEPRPTYPLNRQLHASVIRKLDRAGAKVIAYDVPFTEASDDVAADNALILAVRSAAPRVVLGTDKVDSSGETQIFGGGEGLAFSRATPAATSYSPERRRRHPPHALRRPRARELRARRGQAARGAPGHHEPGGQRLDRLPGAAGDGAPAQLRRRRGRALRPRRRARQGRGRRPHGGAHAGPRADGDGQGHAGRRARRRFDRDRPRGLRAPAGRLVDRPPDRPRARRPGTARGAALRRRGRARRRRARDRGCSSAARCWPSTAE